MVHYHHKDLCLTLLDTGKFFLTPVDGAPAEPTLFPDRSNFGLRIEGSPSLTLGDDGFTLDQARKTENGLTLQYLCRKECLSVTVELIFVPGANVVIQQNRVQNLGEKPILLTAFSSLFWEGIAHTPAVPWYQNQDLSFYVCHNKWQGEGQWQKYTAAQLGLYPTTTHAPERASHKINSVGSWSTANYYPMTVVEDAKNNLVWYAETEGAHSWYLKWYAFGGSALPSLCLEASGCDEKNGWAYLLPPGETYSAPRVFYGVAHGGFEQAAENLNSFKRQDSLVHRLPPLVYNDYMGALWLDQRPESLFPLIDRAAQAGCEVFCIDDGWHVNETAPGLGDWLPCPELYRDCSLSEIASRILKAGMVPGIWMEIETCTPTAKHAYAVLKRHGKPVGGNKWFFDLEQPVVADYLMQRIEALYQMGFRYIKNDYNHSLGLGCTSNLSSDAVLSPAQGARQSNGAFLRFIDKLFSRFPDLTIENCGSGALRCDNATLRHFALQSTSDQEDYLLTPSILMGCAAIMPPEKAGIWAYPYPTTFENYKNFSPADDWLASMADGRQTAFNMVNGLMGTMYLSGRIDLCDELNFSLVCEGVSLAKQLRPKVARSRPVWPLGLHALHKEEVTSFGLLTDEELLLAVWNLTCTPQTVTLQLQQWVGCSPELTCRYPAASPVAVNLHQGMLAVSFPAGESALFVELKIHYEENQK